MRLGEPRAGGSSGGVTDSRYTDDTAGGGADGCLADIESLVGNKIGVGNLLRRRTCPHQMTFEPVTFDLFGHHISFDLNPQGAHWSGGLLGVGSAITRRSTRVHLVATFFLIMSFVWLIWRTLKAW